MNGYTGKILRINLTRRNLSVIPTEKYEAYYGGHGLGSAIFFDLVKDKTIDGLHPDDGGDAEAPGSGLRGDWP